MFKNKILSIAIIILVCVTLLVGAAVVVWMFIINKEDPADSQLKAANIAANTEARTLSADEIVALTSILENVTTNLANQSHAISISLAFQLDSKQTYEEFEKLKLIRVQPIVLKLLHTTTPDELFAENGFDNLVTRLMNEINPILAKGKIAQIDITSFVVDRL